MVEITAVEQNKEKKEWKKDSLRDLWENIKHNNICIIGVPEVGVGGRGPENIFE